MDRLSSDGAARSKRQAVPLKGTDLPVVGQPVQDPPPYVVPGGVEASPRIAEPEDDLHRAGASRLGLPAVFPSVAPTLLGLRRLGRLVADHLSLDRLGDFGLSNHARH